MRDVLLSLLLRALNLNHAKAMLDIETGLEWDIETVLDW